MTIWAVFICFASRGCSLQQTMIYQSQAQCRTALRNEWHHMANGPGVWLECRSKHVETWR